MVNNERNSNIIDKKPIFGALLFLLNKNISYKSLCIV